QLGQTEEANELIHGKPDKIREAAKHLTDFYAAFDRVGTGMRTLDSNGWKGQSGNAFRAKLAMEPKKWLEAADACEAVGTALTRYADTVTWAQDKAKEAIALYKKGVEDSKKAVDAYNSKVDTYNAAVKEGRDPGPELPPFKDPGKAEIERARDLLEEVRRQRNAAGDAVRQVISKATELAPAEPPASNRLASNAIDAYGALNIETLHVAGGVVKGVAGIVNFARGLNPLDIYNITHPAQYGQNVNMTLAGLVSTAAHPERIPGALIESFKKDPSEGLGRLLPEIFGTKGLGGVRTGIRVGAKEGAEAALEGAGKQLDELPQQKIPDQPSHPPTVHDKLHAAADRSVDPDKVPDHAVWRTTDEPLWRNDDRSPDEIFRDGFKPWNNHNYDLDNYVLSNQHSVYVATTRDEALAWGSKYRYEVDAPNGIDVNASIPNNIHAKESEIAFPGGVRTENIKGVWEKLPDGSNQFTPNPHYNPHAGAGGGPAPTAPPASLLPPGWTQ
ncbi:putative T7SS-secreted protein, partial [Streptomyces purpureus]